MVEVAAAAVAEAAAAVLVKFLSGERQPQNLPQSPFNQQNDSRNDDEYKNDNSKENLLQEKQGGLVLLPQQLLMNPRQDSLPVTSEEIHCDSDSECTAVVAASVAVATATQEETSTPSIIQVRPEFREISKEELDLIWNSPRRNRIILKSSSVNQSTRASSSQTSKQASLPPPPPHQTHNNLIKQLPNSTLKFVNKLKQKFRLTKPGKTVGRQVGGLAETSNLESINLESETSPLSKSSVIEPHLDNHDSLINQETLIAQPSSSSSSDSDSLFHVWDHTHCSITDDEDEDYNGNHDVQLTSNQFEYHSSPAFMQLFDDDEVGGTTSSTSERFFRGTDDLLSFTLDRKKERSARQQQRRHRRNSSIGRLSIISDCEGGSGSSSSGSFNILRATNDVGESSSPHHLKTLSSASKMFASSPSNYSFFHHNALNPVTNVISSTRRLSSPSRFIHDNATLTARPVSAPAAGDGGASSPTTRYNNSSSSILHHLAPSLSPPNHNQLIVLSPIGGRRHSCIIDYHGQLQHTLINPRRPRSFHGDSKTSLSLEEDTRHDLKYSPHPSPRRPTGSSNSILYPPRSKESQHTNTATTTSSSLEYPVSPFSQILPVHASLDLGQIPAMFYRFGVYTTVEANPNLQPPATGRLLFDRPHTTYKLTVQLLRPYVPGFDNPRSTTITLSKRYTDFKRLKDQLVRCCNSNISVLHWPPFPPKLFLDRFEPHVIAEREAMFSALLSFIVCHPLLIACGPTVKFLHEKPLSSQDDAAHDKEPLQDYTSTSTNNTYSPLNANSSMTSDGDTLLSLPSKRTLGGCSGGDQLLEQWRSNSMQSVIPRRGFTKARSFSHSTLL